MKLLREIIRLRAVAGRRLLSARRDSKTRQFAVTVPPPRGKAVPSSSTLRLASGQ
jgi:hypothetical protein